MGEGSGGLNVAGALLYSPLPSAGIRDPGFRALAKPGRTRASPSGFCPGSGRGSGESSNSIATVFIMINCAIDETSTENAGPHPDADLELPARDEH